MVGEGSGRKKSQPWRLVGALCSDSEWNGSCRVLNRGATCSKIIERLTLAVLLRTDQGIDRRGKGEAPSCVCPDYCNSFERVSLLFSILANFFIL